MIEDDGTFKAGFPTKIGDPADTLNGSFLHLRSIGAAAGATGAGTDVLSTRYDTATAVTTIRCY